VRINARRGLYIVRTRYSIITPLTSLRCPHETRIAISRTDLRQDKRDVVVKGPALSISYPQQSSNAHWRVICPFPHNNGSRPDFLCIVLRFHYASSVLDVSGRIEPPFAYAGSNIESGVSPRSKASVAVRNCRCNYDRKPI